LDILIQLKSKLNIKVLDDVLVLGQFFLVIGEFSVENRHEIRVSEIFSEALLLFLQSLNINASILCCCDIFPIAKD
jgi:hypothetical protein